MVLLIQPILQKDTIFPILIGVFQITVRRTNSSKVGSVFPIVVVSILPHADFGPNNHREDAPYFTLVRARIVFFSENGPDALKSGSVKLCAGISSTKFRTLGSFFILSLSDFISFNRINHFESKIIFGTPNCYENIIFIL